MYLWEFRKKSSFQLFYVAALASTFPATEMISFVPALAFTFGRLCHLYRMVGLASVKVSITRCFSMCSRWLARGVDAGERTSVLAFSIRKNEIDALFCLSVAAHEAPFLDRPSRVFRGLAKLAQCQGTIFYAALQSALFTHAVVTNYKPSRLALVPSIVAPLGFQYFTKILVHLSILMTRRKYRPYLPVHDLIFLLFHSFMHSFVTFCKFSWSYFFDVLLLFAISNSLL